MKLLKFTSTEQATAVGSYVIQCAAFWNKFVLFVNRRILKMGFDSEDYILFPSRNGNHLIIDQIVGSTV